MNAQSKIGRDDWLRWAGSLLIHVIVTVASTGLTNYFVLAGQVQLLNARLESQTLLWDVQFRALSKQCDELRVEIHELRALRRGAENRAAIDALGAVQTRGAARDWNRSLGAVARTVAAVIAHAPPIRPPPKIGTPAATGPARGLLPAFFLQV